MSSLLTLFSSRRAATVTLTTPAAAATFTHTADTSIEFIVSTVPSSSNILLHFRRQDASNTWRLSISSAGNLTLAEIVAGGATTRGSASGVVAAGDLVVIVAQGSTISVYSGGVLRFTYSSATNYQTLTAGVVASLGGGGVISTLSAYPL
jgi:hypothetical protein